MQISPKQSAILIGVAFLFGLVFFIPTVPGIWHDFKIYELIAHPFISIISLFFFAVLLRIILEKYSLSEYCFIPDGLIVVSIIGMLIEVPHINHHFKEGMMDAIKEEFKKHDHELQNAQEKLVEIEKENESLKLQNSSIAVLNKQLETLSGEKKVTDDELKKANDIIKTDYLKSWEIETSNLLKQCGECKKEQPDNCLCKRDKISTTITSSGTQSPNPDSIPAYDSKSNFDKLLKFNRIGYVYLAYAPDLLKIDFGIDRETFTGTGITIPYHLSSPTTPTTTGIPEFWSPNKSEEDKSVITS